MREVAVHLEEERNDFLPSHTEYLHDYDDEIVGVNIKSTEDDD